MEFRNRAERCHITYLTELSQRTICSSLHGGSKLAEISTCTGQWEMWEWEPSIRGIQPICLKPKLHYTWEEDKDVPRALSLTCTNRIIPTTTKSPLQNHVHATLTNVATSALLKHESSLLLPAPPLKYNHRILSPNNQSKSILKCLTET